LLKVMDYFACGVPVVSTGVSDVQAYGAAVRVASDPLDFVDRIQELLAGTDRYDSSLAISKPGSVHGSVRCQGSASG